MKTMEIPNDTFVNGVDFVLMTASAGWKNLVRVPVGKCDFHGDARVALTLWLAEKGVDASDFPAVGMPATFAMLTGSPPAPLSESAQ